MRRALLVSMLVLSACGGDEAATGDEAAPSDRSGARPTGTHEQAAEERTTTSVESTTTGRAETSAPAAGAPEAPPSGCAFGAPVRVRGGDGWAALASSESGFVVAGVSREGDAEEAFIARVGAEGEVRVIASGALEHPVPEGHRRAAPAVAVDEGRIAMAVVDGRRRLLLAALEGRSLRWTRVGEGASLRFEPALAAIEGWSLAWTVEADAGLRVRAARVQRGEVSEASELRGEAGGAAAPAFVAGARALVFLDPRAGVSVAHRAPVEGLGFGAPSVARPLNLVAEPPEIAAVRAAGAEWIAYTAIGAAATTAVGLARADDASPPTAIVPGTGYGALHVDAATLDGERAVFVADAPKASAPDAPRELHVRVLSAQGALGPPTILPGPATRGRIAHASGRVAVAFTAPTGVHLAVGRCAPR